jgi:hypothetical protein
MNEPSTVTEIAVVGANCPWCLNETIDLLRDEPGVVAVDSDMTDQCLRVRHRGVALDRLLEVVRGHLHAQALASTERVMVEVDPEIAALHCTHRTRPEPIDE